MTCLIQRIHKEVKIWSSIPTNQYVAKFMGYFLEVFEGNIYASLVSHWYRHGDIEKFLQLHPDADREKMVRLIRYHYSAFPNDC